MQDFSSTNDFAKISLSFLLDFMHESSFFEFCYTFISYLPNYHFDLKSEIHRFFFFDGYQIQKNIQQNKIFSHEAWELLKLPKYVLSKLKLMLKPNTIQDNCLHFNTLLYSLDGDNDHSIILVYINIISDIFVRLMSISMNNQINFFKYNFQSKYYQDSIFFIVKQILHSTWEKGYWFNVPWNWKKIFARDCMLPIAIQCSKLKQILNFSYWKFHSIFFDDSCWVV